MPLSAIHLRIIIYLIAILSSSLMTGQSTTYIDSLRATLDTDITGESRTNTYLKLAEIYTRIHPDSSMLFANKALKLATSKKDSSKMAGANFYLSFGHGLKGNQAARIEHVRLGLNLTKDPKYLAMGYNIMGQIYMRKNLDSALVFFKEYFSVTNDYHEVNVPLAYSQLAATHASLDNYHQADSFFDLAIERSEAYRNHSTKSKALYNSALLNYRKGYMESATIKATKSYDIAYEKNSLQIELASLNLLAIIAKNQNDTLLAENYYLKAYNRAKRKGLKNRLYTNILHHLIQLRLENEDFEHAYIYAEELYSLSMSSDNALDKSIANIVFSYLSQAQGIKDNAISKLKEALQDTSSFVPGDDKNYILFHAARIFSSYQLNKSALHIYRQIERELVAHPNKRQSVTLAKKLYEHYKNNGNINKSLEYHEHYQVLKAEWTAALNEKKVLQLNKQFEVNQKNLEIKNQKLTLNLLENKNKALYNFMLLGGFILIFLFLSILFYRSWKNARTASALNVEYSRNLINEREEERKRLARELHDGVGQNLILLKNQLAQNQTQSDFVGKTLEEVRAVSRGLHPFILEKFGLSSAIENLVKEADEGSDIFFDAEIASIDELIPKEKHLHIYRIVQEAISNVIKYSESPSAQISVVKKGASTLFTIKDFGIGFIQQDSFDQTGSLGMKTMQERASIIGAELSIKSVLKKGTQIDLIL